MHHCHLEDFRRRFFVSLLLTLPILLLSFIKVPFGEELLFLFSTVLFLYGGWPFLKGTYYEFVEWNLGMMTLIGMAISIAYLYSSAIVFGLKGMPLFWELATLIDIMLLGHWIEMRAVMGAGKALESLAKLIPKEAHIIDNQGNIKDIPVGDLGVGDYFKVLPGEKIPADGVVMEGESSVVEAALTGESEPVLKEVGMPVIGGAINGEGTLTVKVEKTGKDSFIAQVIDLVKQAESSRSRTQDLANRAAFWLTIIALLGGFVTFIVWWGFLSSSLSFSLERTVSVMVITCPHALGLAIPLVVAVSTSLGAARGLLIRNRSAFEQARNISTIVFDKTGTLTKGVFGVVQVEVFDPKWNSEKILLFAASLEANSEHPIGRLIAKASKEKKQVTEFKSLVGKGVEGKIDGKMYRIASEAYLKDNNIFLNKQITEAKTLAFLLEDKTPLGVIVLEDLIRPESKPAILKLKNMGITSVLLTGDHKQVAEKVAKELGIDDVFSEVLPQEKSETIQQIKQLGGIVAMCGDGVNDAPALALADVGIAIGAGTDVAIETADIILVKSNPLDVPHLIELSKATTRKMIQNLFWATGYNVIAIPIAAGVLYPFGILLSPAVAAVFMSFSTVICAVNAKLLKV